MDTFKKRQKEIEKVILNTTHIYSSVRGIAGNAVKSIKQLELGNDLSQSNKSNEILTNTKHLNNGIKESKLSGKK